ncbi:50S ribosomal protein L15 [Candidatus Kuenenbacteria bacterium]|nr:50S ribosomal protein L15 [Candidatus Kuenenbacteria bacterium]
MALTLSNLKPQKGSKRKAKTIGRGGKRGTYSGRGMKGQKARSGGSRGLKRLGMRQLLERTHKLRGFKSLNEKPAVVSLGTINKNYKDNELVNPKSLAAKKLIATVKHGAKILSDGSINIKINVDGCSLSQAAETKIKAAGGTISPLPTKKTEKKENSK